jgi:hypothetical protein
MKVKIRSMEEAEVGDWIVQDDDIVFEIKDDNHLQELIEEHDWNLEDIGTEIYKVFDDKYSCHNYLRRKNLEWALPGDSDYFTYRAMYHQRCMDKILLQRKVDQLEGK